jgi:acyl-CoA synthetase (AMP-forming)/AMP-acid ligase II
MTERGPRPISWQELYDGARDLARGLAWLGLRPGDRIGVSFEVAIGERERRTGRSLQSRAGDH